MNRMEDAKRKYAEVPIPAELSERVLQEVEKANRRRKYIIVRQSTKKLMRRGLTAVAVLAVVFAVGLNTSTAFAGAAADIPIIGGLARVFTFRSYETKTDDLKISVHIPGIDMISQEFSELEVSVNTEIHALCQAYADEAVKRAEEYRQAFMDTGGTEEEWEAHNIQIKVWYEVKAQTEEYLSLAIMGAENWSSAYSKTRYYNFDLREGKIITLKDVLGEDYAQLAGESIRLQMKEREESGGVEFFDEELPEVNESTAFYMNEAGHPVIAFEKYEIAPGAAGPQEFEIVQ